MVKWPGFFSGDTSPLLGATFWECFIVNFAKVERSTHFELAKSSKQMGHGYLLLPVTIIYKLEDTLW